MRGDVGSGDGNVFVSSGGGDGGEAGTVYAVRGGEANYGCSTGYMEADYTYNSAGQVASYGTYSPTLLNYFQIAGEAPPVEQIFTYGYDGMGRPVSLTDNSGQWNSTGQNYSWVNNVQYDYAGRRSSFQSLPAALYGSTWGNYQTETETYNVNGQIASATWSGGMNGVADVFLCGGTE